LVEEAAPELTALAAVLSDEERERAGRFRFEADRRRAVVAHGALRLILGERLGRDPAALGFRAGAKGKPELLRAPGDPPLEFNVSHSGDLVLIGVAVGRRIGVDVERVRDGVSIEAIAGRFFAPEEAAAIRAAPAAERAKAFSTWWTAKEAYLKALGQGLSGGLGSFTVIPGAHGWDLRRGESAKSEAPVAWTIRSLELRDGYAAAVAVEGEAVEVEVVGCPPRFMAVMTEGTGNVGRGAGQAALRSVAIG
jgi:4'-phosphopantetheinyl transferase